MPTFTPLDAAHQTTLQTSAAANAMIAAVEAAGIVIEFNSVVGYQATDAAAAQTIISTVSMWLPQAQQLKLAALLLVAASKISAGLHVTIQAVRKLYQIDASSRQDIFARAALASASIAGNATWPAGFVWIAADNTTQAMAATDFLTFAQAVGDYINGVVINTRTLKNQILATTTALQLASIDITAGWPADG